MRKMFKIILIVLAVILIAVVVAGVVVFADLASYTATGSETLLPSSAAVGKAPRQIGKKSLFVQLRTPRMREDGYLFGVRVVKT